MRKKVRREDSIQEEIECVLQRQDWLYVMHNDTGVTMGANSLFQYGQRGAPDILVFVAPLGRLVGLELKAKYKKMSADQIAWKAAAERVGAVVVEAKGDAAVDVACNAVLGVYGQSRRLQGPDPSALEHDMALRRAEIAEARAAVRAKFEKREAKAKIPFRIRGTVAKRQHAL